MPNNFCSLPLSYQRTHAGRAVNGQGREKDEAIAAAPAACRTAVIEGCAPGRSGATRGRLACHGVRMERAIRTRWAGRAAAASARAARWIRRGDAQPTRAAAHGRSAGPWLRHRALDAHAHRSGNRAAFRNQVQRSAGVAHSGRLGLELPAPHWASTRTRRSGHPAVATEALAGAKKTPQIRIASSSSSTSPD